MIDKTHGSLHLRLGAPEGEATQYRHGDVGGTRTLNASTDWQQNYSTDAVSGGDRFLEAGRVFERLQEVVFPELLARKASGAAVRAWIIDCGAGEEAYSLAMLLCESIERAARPIELQVFATEMDRAALAAARSGRFPQTIAGSLSPERLARWFVRQGNQFCVTKELRETCIFSAHDVTKDMPFSRMDIICARSPLNILNADLQDQLIQLFSFSLRADGYLLAGPASSVGRHPDLFRAVGEAPHVFRRMNGPTRLLPRLPVRPRAAATQMTDGRARRSLERDNTMESELRSTREELRHAIERIEIANRDLQRANEVYLAVNRDLAFSKEELNSTNKELETVNGELNYRMRELARTNSDLRNFLDSNQVATVFLDQTLRIVKFTTAAANVLGLTTQNLGSSIGEISSELVYEGLTRDVAHVLRRLEVVERQLHNRSGDGHYLVRITPYRDIDNVIAGAVLTFVDITAVRRAEDALRRSEERFEMMAVTVPAALFTADAELLWDYVNPRFYDFTGLADGAALGEGWLAAVYNDDVDEVRHRLAVSRESGDTFELEFRMRDTGKEYRWYLARATAVRSPDGDVARWAGSLMDIHERRVGEARQRLMFAELQHRVKNILAVVRSIAGLTLETSSSLDDFAQHFDGRLNALARTQASLARHGKGGLDLEELIAEELLSHAPADEEQIAMSGPPIHVGERAAEALVLTIHELATNAVKYGAFAAPAGKVRVSWKIHQVASEDQLHLEWLEQTVPVIDPNPKRVGFGRELLERGLPFELDAQTTLEFRPGGLRFVLDVPLANILVDNLEWAEGVAAARES